MTLPVKNIMEISRVPTMSRIKGGATKAKYVILITDEACSSAWCFNACPSGHWCRSLVDRTHTLAADQVMDLMPAGMEVRVFSSMQGSYQPLETLPMSLHPKGMSDALVEMLLGAACE